MFRVEGVVAGCELVRIISRCRGMLGAVYLAVDRATRRRVALKVIRGGVYPGGVGSFAAERYGAELQRQLAGRTSAVPAVHRWGERDGAFHLVMDYVEGTDLDTMIGDGACLSAVRAASIASALCRYLAIAHAPRFVVDGTPRSIIHGDLKPENIRITGSGAVRILDFGSATAVTPGVACAHSGGLTPEYASPERLATHVVDPRADLWAVGIILHEALTGSRPSGRPDLSGMDPALARIVTRSLALSDANRYPSAAAMGRELDEFVRHAEAELRTPLLQEAIDVPRLCLSASAAINVVEMGWNER